MAIPDGTAAGIGAGEADGREVGAAGQGRTDPAAQENSAVRRPVREDYTPADQAVPAWVDRAAEVDNGSARLKWLGGRMRARGLRGMTGRSGGAGGLGKGAALLGGTRFGQRRTGPLSAISAPGRGSARGNTACSRP